MFDHNFKLKDCPVCGKPAELFEDAKGARGMAKCSDPKNYCILSLIGLPWLTWNTRPIEDALRADLDAAKREIAELKKQKKLLTHKK